MNLVEIWVTNITSHTKEDRLHHIVADFNCYGRKEYQKEEWLTDFDWKMVQKKGYYLV